MFPLSLFPFLNFTRYAHNNAIKLDECLIKLSLHQLWFFRCELRFGSKNCFSVSLI